MSETIEMQAFQESLKLLMSSHKVTAKELSTSTGISPSTISQWLNADQEPKADALLKLSRHFNCSIEFLLTGTTEEKKIIESIVNEFQDEFIEVFKGTYRIKIEKHIGRKPKNR